MNKELPPDNQSSEENSEDFDEVDQSLLLADELTDKKTRISVEKTADGDTIMKIEDESEDESN